jgi:hypothetical protein
MTGRIEAIAREAVRRTARAAAARIAAALPGVEVEAGDDRVVLSGRGLARRLSRDPVLRWLGSLWR